MKKNFFKIATIVLSIIFVVLAITLVSMKVVNGKEKEDKELLLSKITDELSFIDYNIIDAMNKLNNINVTRYKVYTKIINNGKDSPNSSNIDQGTSGGNPEQSESGNADQSSSEESSGESSSSSNGGQSSSGGSSSSSENKSSSNGGGSSSESSSGNSNGTNKKETDLTLVNSLTESDGQETNWDTITNIYENLVSTWPTTQLDLKKAGIDNERLENNNIHLNGIAQSILNKDKNSCLINLYNLYSQIPSYMEILSTDDYTTNLYSTKMELLNAYSLANSNKWIEITSSIKSAEEKFEKIVNSAKNEKEKNNLEKIYTMIKNLENTVALNNKNIFYMQYKNVIQEISNL